MRTESEWSEMRERYRQGVLISQIANEEGLSRNTVRRYVQTDIPPAYVRSRACEGKLDPFKPYIRQRLKEYPLSAARLLDEIKTQGYSGGYTILKEFTRSLRHDRSIPAEIRFPQKVPSQVSVLTEAEMEELRGKLRGMPGWYGSVARFMVAMYGYSGLRRTELRRARITDLDTESWIIVVAHPKGEKTWATEAVAKILKPAREEILAFLECRKEYLREHGLDEHEALVPYAFRDGSVGYFTDGMWGSMKDDAQRYAGMPFKIQQLRASFAQMCKDQGASIEAVSRALRHSTTVTTERYYARIRPEAAFRELEDAFDRSRRAR